MCPHTHQNSTLDINRPFSGNFGEMWDLLVDFPGGSDGKESACNAGDSGSIPGLVRYPGEGNNNPLQDSCLKNPMDRGAWQATDLDSQESDTT